jgi:hypothetical protein
MAIVSELKSRGKDCQIVPFTLTKGISPSPSAKTENSCLEVLAVGIDFLNVDPKAEVLNIFRKAGGIIGRFALMIPRRGTIEARTPIVERL